MTQENIKIQIPAPHSEAQESVIRCLAKRVMVKAGRRFGKTLSAAIRAIEAFLGVCSGCAGQGCTNCDGTGKVAPKRVMYAAPTDEQVDTFWFEVTRALEGGVKAKRFKQNNTKHTITVPGTQIRIRAKTAWNADSLRGDKADLLILEEYQLMNEDAWQQVGQPMLMDSNGDALFIFTPPSLSSKGVFRGRDPRHASKLFREMSQDKTGVWKTFHYTSYDNPLLNQEAIGIVSEGMTADSFRREIMAEDDEIEDSWLVYSVFDEEYGKIPRFDIPQHWVVYSGHDFGSANPAALFIAEARLPLPKGAPDRIRYGDYIVFSEYSPGGGLSARQHADSFRSLMKSHTMGASVGGNVTTEDEIRQAYRAEGWNIRAPAIAKVNGQIERVIRLMEHRQLFIFDDLFRLLGQVANCMWVLDEEQQPTNKIRNEAQYHMLACLRYVATVLNMPSSLSGEESNETYWDDVPDRLERAGRW